MKKFSGQEKRRHPRVNSTIVTSYHMQQEDNNYNLSQTKNVSLGGMLLTTSRRFDKGTPLSMTVCFPFLDQKTQVSGEVIDSREVVKGILYDTRLRFKDLEVSLLQGFDRFIHEKLALA